MFTDDFSRALNSILAFVFTTRYNSAPSSAAQNTWRDKGATIAHEDTGPLALHQSGLSMRGTGRAKRCRGRGKSPLLVRRAYEKEIRVAGAYLSRFSPPG